MNLFEKTKPQVWLPYAIAGSVVAAVFIALNHFGAIWGKVVSFLEICSPVAIGLVLAYILNLLVMTMQTHLLANVKSEKTRRRIAIVLALGIVVGGISLLTLFLVPQIIKSLQELAINIPLSIAALQDSLNESTLAALGINPDTDEAGQLMARLSSFVLATVTENSDDLLSLSLSLGAALFDIVLGTVLAIYFLFDWERLFKGARHAAATRLSEKSYTAAGVFLHRCNDIMASYIGYNFVDALIVGFANALFMAVLGMPYIILISVVIALCNLIPTFGPVVGGAIGALILLLGNPIHALIFIIFTMILQTIDGYIIKPQLFGETLGVSGLWILIAIVVLGRLFGVIGILVAIPVAAICDFSLQNYLAPRLRGESDEVEELKAIASSNLKSEAPASPTQAASEQTD